MIHVNAMGDACPIPVVKTKNAIKEMQGAGEVEILVDNEIAVQNLTKMANQKGYGVRSEKLEEQKYRVVMTVGEVDNELGGILIKGFIYALTQQDELPSTMLFYNGGAKLTCEASPTLEDLKSLEAQGVEILTCGTCLNHYGLTDKLQVGGVTNMYVIAEKMMTAGLIIKP
jgi:TusA-related sulfurtransferase